MKKKYDNELVNRVYSFKNELKSISSYQSRLIEINNEILKIENDMDGVKSVPFDAVIRTKQIAQSGEGFFGQMMTLDKLKEESVAISYIINRAERVLCSIQNPTERQMIRDLYIRKRNAEYTAMKYGYTKTTMYRRVNEILFSILQI